MKDIVSGTSLTETKKQATEKWHDYKAAAKAYKDPIYADLQKIYNQVKGGKKVIDIHKVIAKGGIHQNFHPKLAIAKATNKKVWCVYENVGNIRYMNNEQDWRSRICAADIVLKDCLPIVPDKYLPKASWSNTGHTNKFELSAPVPLIPAKLRPQKLTDDYYILWEVDTWQMIPPTDPYLLRRITKNMFVVVAGWDLTEIEKAAMAGRMY